LLKKYHWDFLLKARSMFFSPLNANPQRISPKKRGLKVRFADTNTERVYEREKAPIEYKEEHIVDMKPPNESRKPITVMFKGMLIQVAQKFKFLGRPPHTLKKQNISKECWNIISKMEANLKRKPG
jgi:hypothetical protein